MQPLTPYPPRQERRCVPRGVDPHPEPNPDPNPNPNPDPNHAKAGDDAKLFVLIESGVRVHLTTYERDKAQIPSNFTLKLRKHVRTRRIEKVEQLGADRASACGAGPPRWCHSFGPRLPHALQRSAPVAAQHGATAAATLTPTLTLTLALTLTLTLTQA